ncbi:MAG: hypothetical protein UT12_C0006G0003 [Candidatus Curtissbacteria bacterium GW2011_GWC2_38_9]|uniref:Uncharacterized protein n=1 Tax=Candidatus Curtissbacteria bacterium GW2011_GWC2_38_9 TaxID=1618414 RepID=A0A0G0LPJ6_9BACT|nr:MAG: hypothetical protein UT12_C0006G0003 [Candidatus Curtissbacteria bacterium GW2011_GWC2_38_9]KKR17512.1 MAG: hypothetical protein UT45_C0001G0187 [Candidatus Daviesbacteria bacterium GW2011_GWA2_39_33]
MKSRGFTLVELLVTIAIISILSAVVILIVNPMELLRRSRDVTRLKDLDNLQQAINIAMQDAVTSEKDVLCNGADFPCSGKSGGNGAGTRVSDGTGWVKVNLSAQKAVSLPTLPVDPVNDLVYHYTYCADTIGWEINTTLESDQLSYKMAADGGNEADKYEVGSNYLLLASGSGVCEF